MNERNPYAPPQSTVRDQETPPEPEELASRWARLGASLLDSLVLSIVIVPLMFLTGYWAAAVAGSVPPLMLIGVMAGSFALFCAVNGYLLATAGQTVGKRLVGTRIVNVADGNLPTLSTLLGKRYGLMYLLNAIPLVGTAYSVIDPLFVFRTDKRCLHDLIAGTKVVNVEGR